MCGVCVGGGGGGGGGEGGGGVKGGSERNGRQGVVGKTNQTEQRRFEYNLETRNLEM